MTKLTERLATPICKTRSTKLHKRGDHRIHATAFSQSREYRKLLHPKERRKAAVATHRSASPQNSPEGVNGTQGKCHPEIFIAGQFPMFFMVFPMFFMVFPMFFMVFPMFFMVFPMFFMLVHFTARVPRDLQPAGHLKKTGSTI